MVRVIILRRMGDHQIGRAAADEIGDAGARHRGTGQPPIRQIKTDRHAKISQPVPRLGGAFCRKGGAGFGTASRAIGGNAKRQPIAASGSHCQKPIGKNFQIIRMGANRGNVHAALDLSRLDRKSFLLSAQNRL